MRREWRAGAGRENREEGIVEAMVRLPVTAREKRASKLKRDMDWAEDRLDSGGEQAMVTGDQIIERATALKERFGLTRPDDDVRKFSKSLVKGLIAGLVGGLAGTAAKTMAEKVYPPRIHGEPEPPSTLADKLTGGQLQGSQKAAATEAIHWGFGALTGAAYGALAEFYPAATSKEGASFGLTLAALTHDAALPAMGVSAEPRQQSQREQTSEMVTHVIFGVVTEVVRSLTRKMLN